MSTDSSPGMLQAALGLPLRAIQLHSRATVRLRVELRVQPTHGIGVPYVRTVDKIADFFTKPLPNDVFFRMRDAIMNCGRHSPIPASRSSRGT